MKEVYLDWAAAAPTSARAKRAFVEAMDEFGNPSSPHAFGVRAHQILEDARLRIARLAMVKPDGVIFTSGATEANNLAICGYINALLAGGRNPDDIHLLYLPTSHASVVETMHMLMAGGIQVEEIAVTDGAIDLGALKKQIRPATVLVSADVICGETGTRWNVRDVRRVIDKAHEEMRISEADSHDETSPRRAASAQRTLLHVDASQAPFVESIDHTHLGADLITLDAQKIGGVRGIGALIRANTLVPLASLSYGGGQEFGLRPGTENPALALAFAVALEEANENREAFVVRARSARSHLLDTLTASIPDMLINTGKESSLTSSIFHFYISTPITPLCFSQKKALPSQPKAPAKPMKKDPAPSSILFNDPVRARSTLRISWGPVTSKKDIDKFGLALAEVIRFLAANVLTGKQDQ